MQDARHDVRNDVGTAGMQKQDERFTLRLSETEKLRLQLAAKERGTSPAEFVRRAIRIVAAKPVERTPLSVGR